MWARVTPVRGTEAHVVLGRVADSTHVFRVRYHDAAELEPSWRLRWDGKEFGIDEIRPGGAQLREYIEIIATAGSAENPNL